MLSSLLLGFVGVATVLARDTKRFHWDRDASTGHGTIRTQTSETGAVVRLTLHNPPINVYDQNVAQDFYDFIQSITLETPDTDGNKAITWPKVVIISSDIKSFWVGSYDINLIAATNQLDPQTTNKSSRKAFRPTLSFQLCRVYSLQRQMAVPLVQATNCRSRVT